LRPARSHPGALVRSVTTANIASHLPRMAEARPWKRAVVVPAGQDAEGHPVWAHYTFAELNEASDAYARGLRHIGIVAGTRTVLMVKPSLEFFALVFALFKVGAVLVLIDPGIGKKALRGCLQETDPEAFIGVPLAHVARLVFGRALSTVRINVTVGRRWFWGGYRLPELKVPGNGEPFEMDRPDPDQVAAILFTSGSTGLPKGAVYTHGMFDAQVRALREMYRFDGDEVDLATFPLFALFDPALGMTSVIPDMDARKPGSADPAKIAHAVLSQGCTNMFASPALLRNLGRWGQQTGVKLGPLRRVLSSGAPARKETLEQVADMLTGNAEIFTPYGATEALPVAHIGSYEVLGETAEGTAAGKGICVGKPVPGTLVRVIGITDEAIETWSDDLIVRDGIVGEITVRGPVVTREYHGRPAQTALAKIEDGGEVVHRMGDLGYFDERGRLWMCGRKAHRVETDKGPMFTVPVERVFDEHPAIRRSALVGVGEPGAQRPVLLVEREAGWSTLKDAELLDKLRELRDGNPATRQVREIIVYPGSFPVDVRHNAKIERERLTVWANARYKTR
jgi:olefin beta-lactone synthetase